MESMEIRRTEVSHSVGIMLCRLPKVDGRGESESYWYEEVRPKV